MNDKSRVVVVRQAGHFTASNVTVKKVDVTKLRHALDAANKTRKRALDKKPEKEFAY